MTDSRDGADDVEVLADFLDVASAIEARARASAIAEVQSKVKPQQLPRADGTYEFLDCDECGNEIGLGRLAVAAKNRWCVHCASAKERRK